MKQLLKKRIGLSILLVFGTAVLSSLYQNCSKVTLNDLDAEAKAAEAERVAIGKDDELVTAGISPVPGLSMYFFVDNSGTMVQNQLNLAASFGAMFDASAASLAKFDTTTYILNTAQRSPQFSSELSVLDTIATRQQNFTPGWIIDLNTFLNVYRTSTTNGGQIPGDNLGYHLKKSNQLTAPIGTLTYNFQPGYLQGASANGNQVTLSPSIHKAALEDSQYMKDEFKRRLDVLSATRFPYSKGIAEFANIVDAESGLCSVARVLRNQTPGAPNAAIRADNLTSMVIVSDENDNDPQGNNCIQSFTQTSDSTLYSNGQCRLPATSIRYRASTPNPDTCSVTPYTGYKATWTYPNPRIGTFFRYLKKFADAYYKKRTYYVKYLSNTPQYQVRQTSLSFYGLEGNPIVTDGIVTNQDSWEPIATVINKPAVTGYYSAGANCLDLAKTHEVAINRATGQKGLKVDTTRAYTCTYAWVNSSTTCDTSDPNKCQIIYPELTKTSIYGGVYSAAVGQAYADAQSDHKPGTAITGGGQESDSNVANCPSADQTAGKCYQVAADIRMADKTVDDVDMYTAQSCYTYANNTANLPDSMVNNNPANVTGCARMDYGSKTLTVQMTFSESNDGGTTQSVNTNTAVESCTNVNVRTKALQLAQAQDSVITAANRCSLVEVTKKATTYQSLNSPAYANCTAQVAAWCAVNEASSRCASGQGGSSPSLSGWTDLVVNLPEAVTCATKCSDSLQNACAGENPTLTIAQHIQAKYGGGSPYKTMECNLSSSGGYIAVGSDPGVTTHTGILISQKGTICDGLPGPKRVYVATASDYPKPAQLITDYVAGTTLNASGQPVPAMSLVNYIKQRSQELTGGSIIFTALVRRSTDPLGANGSTGVAYEQLVQQTGGQLESVLSSDYSVALQNLSSVIKNNLEKTFLLKKMRPSQIITRVTLYRKGGAAPQILTPANWVQMGATLRVEGIEFVEGDQFKVEFQNYIP